MGPDEDSTKETTSKRRRYSFIEDLQENYRGGIKKFCTIQRAITRVLPFFYGSFRVVTLGDLYRLILSKRFVCMKTSLPQRFTHITSNHSLLMRFSTLVRGKGLEFEMDLDGFKLCKTVHSLLDEKRTTQVQ